MNIFLGLIILLWAIALGATSTYFSVTGLALTIYSGALLPVIIMGAGVEGSKFLIVAWLHTYWHKISWGLKLTSLFFVACIMVLTSAGVFAFLSKAHNGSVEPTESFELKIEQIENQITLYRRDVDRYQKQLDQLDKNIDKQIDSGKTTRDQILVQQQRDKQKIERDQIYGLIEKTNQKINELQNQKFDNKQNVVNLDLKLAPVKAIASVIGVDANEHAVNFVNAWFVLVFDPVAIFMVIMAQYCFTFRNREKNKHIVDNTPGLLLKSTDENGSENISEKDTDIKIEPILKPQVISDKSTDKSTEEIISSEHIAEVVRIEVARPTVVQSIVGKEEEQEQLLSDIKIKKDRRRSNRKRNKKILDDKGTTVDDTTVSETNISTVDNNSTNENTDLPKTPESYSDTVVTLGTAFQPIIQQSSQIINTTPAEQIKLKQTGRTKRDNQEIVEKLKKDQELLKELMDIVSQAVPGAEPEQNTGSVDNNWLDKRMFDPKGSGV